MIINTDVPYNYQGYWLIRSDLHSASADKPLGEQEYAVEKTEVIERDRREATRQ